MSVYYYKLWQQLEARSIDEHAFFESLRISPGTVIKLKKDIPVSMDIIDRIREGLGCDYGDIITAHPDANRVPTDWLSENVKSCSEICRNVLRQYMEDFNLSVSDLMKLTSLSRNTIKEFLNGGIMTSRTLLRLYRLDEFCIRFSDAVSSAGLSDQGFEHLEHLQR